MARKKFNTIWPLPVYVATFADGEVVRFSFGSPAGKPLDFERGRRMVCHAARHWEEAAAATIRGHWDNSHPYYSTPNRADIVAGQVEVDGQVFPDPHFEPAAAPVLRVVRGGKAPTKAAYERILAALPELSFDQLDELERVLADVINEKLAA